MHTQIPTDLVSDTVQSIFSTMIGLDVFIADESSPCLNDRLTSSVHLEGEWNGVISFECSRLHACQIAGHFMAVDPPDEVDDDVRDVLGELANMIGGNIKSTLAADVRLSLPSVVEGSNYAIHVCGSDAVQRIAFGMPEGIFWVTIQTKNSGEKAASLSGRTPLEVLAENCASC